MKLWIVMLLVMVTIIVGGLYLEHSILKTTDYLFEALEQVQDHVRGNQWQEAKENFAKLNSDWLKQKEHWSPFIHNHDLDVITGHLVSVFGYLETQETAHILAEINLIKLQLNQLHDQELLSLKSIF